MLNGSNQGSCRAECVVDNQRDATFFSKCREAGEVGNVEAGIAHRFHIDGLGLVINLRRETRDIVTVGKLDLDP